MIFYSPIFVVSRLDPVEWLSEGGVRDVLVVHLFDLEAVGEVLELDVGVFLDRQLRVGDRLGEVGTQVVEDLMKRFPFAKGVGVCFPGYNSPVLWLSAF